MRYIFNKIYIKIILSQFGKLFFPVHYRIYKEVMKSECYVITSQVQEKKRDCCFGCEYARDGIPCGYCEHPLNYYESLSDEFMFDKKPDNCPLIWEKKKAQAIECSYTEIE